MLDDLDAVVEKSEVAIGMEIENWVLEKDIWFDLSSSRSDHFSRPRPHMIERLKRIALLFHRMQQVEIVSQI